MNSFSQVPETASGMREASLLPPAEATERCQSPGADSGRVASGKRALLDEETYMTVAEIFRALADSSRAKIVYSLLKQELCTCDLAAITGISESAVSQHLRVLRQLRLVKNRRAGKLVFYNLDDAHIRTLLVVGLNHVSNGDRHHEGLGKILAVFEQETTHTPQEEEQSR
jgi:ArsR family transcriptional regulator, lead/cadmium/zinc/bismuth-responsive transcriptional repressor